ncbi:MAG: dolichyl-phosphate beta-D-mannosyltransferase [Chloroflexi bacterium]|nr:MAG: dolichyl-phosphate beta-D-mannosyltransferase [Chloroflexota bacterium]
MYSATCVVLPTYNERENLEKMVGAIGAAAPGINILVVDDNSPDGTGVLADGLAAASPTVSVLHRQGKEGLGAAYRAGFREALARPGIEYVVQMDCDFSHDPSDLPRLLKPLVDDPRVGLVIGSRYVAGGGTPGWSTKRRVISRGGSLFARTVLHLPFRDLTGGFKAWRRDTLAAQDLSSGYANGYGFQIEMTWSAFRRGARIVEIPITFRDRVAGNSKMSGAIMREALLMVLRLRLATFPTRRGRRRRPEATQPPS